MTKLIAGSSSLKLAKKLSNMLGIDFVDAQTAYFEDRELRVEVANDLRGKDVVIVQSTSNPVNDHLMELLLLVNAVKYSGASRVIAVLPYFGYARQNKVTSLNGPISAQLVSTLFEVVGVDHLITVDLHAQNITDFFSIPVQNVETTPLFADFLRNRKNLMIVSPDAGSRIRAQKLSQALGCNFAVMNKIRKADTTCQMSGLNTNVAGYDCILVDDIIDTGSTLCSAAEFLVKQGALSVEAVVTHAVLSVKAAMRVEKSVIKQVSITQTIEHQVLPLKFHSLDVALLLISKIKVLFEKDQKQ